MRSFSNKKKGFAFTFIMCILLLATILGIITYMYKHSETEAYERLDLEMEKQKKSISLQLISDRETLSSMANLIGMNYDSNEGYIEVCKAFESFGLCDDIGILVPNDILITKHGESDVKGTMSFEEEKQKGAYICRSVTDATNENLTIIRSSVPIVDANGNTKGILYGVITSDKFAEHYENSVSSAHSYLCIIDAETGKFIIDTKDVLNNKNITNLSSVEYNNDYNYEALFSGIKEGKLGYSNFISNDQSDFLYVCYDSLGIENWRIMLGQPNSIVLASTNSTISFLVATSGIICLIVLIYVFVISYANGKKSRLNYVASEIRKNLLKMSAKNDSLKEALKLLTDFAKSRSAFITDSYEEECHYIRPEKAADKLNPDEIRYLNNKLLYYTSVTRKTRGASLYNSVIKADKTTRREMPDLYDFMAAHNIKLIIYCIILNESSNTYILGALNPKNRYAGELLNKISACFSMALYNRNHLEITHQMAFKDSLTGVKNRMAWSVDRKTNNYKDVKYTCVYIDANELNLYNNKHGHAAGDQMLKFIGEVLRKYFFDSDIYRMGGDEFLILNKTVTDAEIDERLSKAVNDIEEMKYHIAFGVKQSSDNETLEETVNAAEKQMYKNKAFYYQEKDLKKIKTIENKSIKTITTGVKELDACLSVMSRRYLGIYLVSLDNDTFTRILSPVYFENADESNLLFSQTIRRYNDEFVGPKYHRRFLAFLEYDVLKNEFKENKVPEISYTRIDGVKVTLKVYPANTGENQTDCIWVFEKN